MNLGLKNTIKGRYNLKTCERERTVQVRRRAFQHKQCNFDGSFSAYSRLPEEDRHMIDAEIAKDIAENASDWDSSPIIELAETGFQDNLILNRGLDWCCDYAGSFGNFSKYHVLGTGTAAPSATDTILQTETSGRRSGTYLTGSGNCGVTSVNNVVTFRRTYDHGLEVGSINYTEHGVSHADFYGGVVNTRALITGGTLSLVAGQQARCVYDIVVTVNPGSITPITVGGSGWPVLPATTCSGKYIASTIVGLLGGIDISGDVSATGYSFLIGNGITSSFAAYAASSVTLPSFGSNSPSYQEITGSSISYTRDPYTLGTFTFTYRPNAYATATAWASTSVAGWRFRNSNSCLWFKYDQNQTKANTHRLRYPSITVTWST